MKNTSALISSLIGLGLSVGSLTLNALPQDTPPVNREEIRRQLQALPPEERRALIKELRDQKAQKPDKPKPGSPPPVIRREEVSRELRDLPPEARRDRIRELRGLPPDQGETPRADIRRPSERELQRGERPAFGGPPAGQPGWFAPMFERVLTEDQRASFREAMESHRGEVRELEEKLRTARREALQASVGREFHEEAVREKAMAAARLEAEFTVLRARMLSRVKPPLSPGQLEKLRNPMPLEGGAPRPEYRRDEPPRGDRPARGPRDEHDLPPRPRPEQ